MTPSRLLRIVQQRFRSLTRPSERAHEIDRELGWHFDLLIEEKLAQGLSADAARREARREFGPLTALAERSRDAHGLTWLADIRQDARYAISMLRRSPGFATIASLSLALGVGASAAVTGAIALVLARPLPFPESDRLVTIHATRADGSVRRGGWSPHEYALWRDRSRTLQEVGASLSSPRVIGAEAGGLPAERVPAQAFTPNVFRMLGVQPAVGQLFEETVNPLSRPALVTVISDRLWQRRYAAAPAILGRTITVDGTARRIVGVMRPDFRFQDANVDLWIPLSVASPPAALRAPRTGGVLVITARLAPGATVEQAASELSALANANPAALALRVVPLREALYGWTRPRLLTLAGAVLLVLTLASANIAGLLLARAAARRPEVAMRVALGATRGRIIRQLVTESLVLGLAAGVLGIAVAAMSVPAVTAALGPPPGLPRLDTLRLDAWMLAAVLLFAVISSVAFGLVPALVAGRGDIPGPLNPGATRPHISRGRARDALVAAQIALAEVLLVGATLLSISFLRLSGRELNFDPRGLLTFEYAIAADRFAQPLNPVDGVPSFAVSPFASRTIDQVYERLHAVNAASEVGGMSYPPVNSLVLPMIGVRPLDRAIGQPPLTVAYFLVTPHVFAALRTPVVRGREFDGRDVRSAPWTVVVNQALAQRLWPGEDPVGRLIRIEAGSDEPARRVIGVVGDIPTRLDETEPRPTIYASYLQQPARYSGPAVGMFGSMTFVARPSVGGAMLLDAARDIAAQLTPGSPIGAVGTVQAHLTARLAERRNYVAALCAFAVAAAVLAAIGLYGILAYDVHARSGEIAVRTALGAGWPHLVVAIGRPAAATVAGGVIAGLAGAVALARLLTTQLWGIAPFDPATFTGVSLALLALTLAACVVPLRDAVTLDPATRLRGE